MPTRHAPRNKIDEGTEASLEPIFMGIQLYSQKAHSSLHSSSSATRCMFLQPNPLGRWYGKME